MLLYFFCLLYNFYHFNNSPNNYQFNGTKKPWMSENIAECFNDFMRNELFKKIGTVKTLLLLNRLLKTYRFYMNEAIKIIDS